ncbi:hypothetical protein COV06_02175 [Candidatus Uhrbacteria bacterium CG10_big_fil_rev_8_21_14_0_10_50_16]|uniref:Glycosyltransferase RgtA/B/C/D-like domain-containing protein n=1 Tax=Candidatus Uhrbacteria bacterium CG10_big_fil_rev_8_21_14_0_10_50_16 TaxID=1975039 RepID=A0A2H0RME0_9BACT|nr:MAG: hypothetical protein COV06_02175 [Candidatus Uhrbacteria bacterium CG10_big_fil_rev_8_21_14_0_10_50_16]
MARNSRMLKGALTGLAATVLFFVYVWFPLAQSGVWSAPDEMAAAFAVEHVPLFGGDYTQTAAYTDTLGGLVHPRSLLVQNGMLVPSTWLGLPWLLRVLSILVGTRTETLGMLVALISVFAVFSWKQIVQKLLHNEVMGWVAALTLAVHPGWWYFTARGLHPNVVFVSLLIFGVFAWYVAANKVMPKRADFWRLLMIFLGGASFGMAIFVRTNEAIWILPVLLLVAWYQKKKPFAEHLLAVAGVLIPLVLMLVTNNAVYGGPFLTGYTVSGDPIPVTVEVTETVEPIGFSQPLLARLFPFGIHEQNIANNVVSFHMTFFALWTAFALFGCILLLVDWQKLSPDRRRRLLRCVWPAVLVSVYLFVVYGSWNIHDNPDPLAVTIGTSYIRYWLPISVVMTVPVAYAIIRGVQHRSSKAVKQVIIGIWIVAFVYTGFTITNFGRDEGLAFIAQNLQTFTDQRERVLDLTEENDLIIVDRSDKFLFPARQVVYPLRSETTYAALPLMMQTVEDQGASLYYLGITFPQEDLDSLHKDRLIANHLLLIPVEEIGLLTLYQFERAEFDVVLEGKPL